MAEQKEVTITLEIHGFIWQRDDKPIRMTVYSRPHDRYMYLESPTIDELFKRKAQERGIQIGELVDEVNQEIAKALMPINSWLFGSISTSQMNSISEFFNG